MENTEVTRQPGHAAEGATGILVTLAAGQFLMALDSSVMNVSMATVAEDVGTSITGVQTALTLYTLVMAMFMITGGKVGAILGRRRAFALGCLVYGAGSLLTALSPNLPVLLMGWSVLEGLGAALIMPAIVALVASNFDPAQRARAYGTIAAFGAIAVAVGPLLGGVLSTYASWRWVFAGEVLVVLLILMRTRRMADAPPDPGVRLDLVGTALSAAGLGLMVFAVLRVGTWGPVNPTPQAPSWLGLSPVPWVLLSGGLMIRLFLAWESRQLGRAAPVLVDPRLLSNARLRGGLVAFFLQYLVQAGLFFAVPLFLSVALGLPAVDTGIRVLPLSLALLITAVAVPRLWPTASPRRLVRTGFTLLLAGVVVLMGALDVGVGPEVVTWPLLLAGVGMGVLASQLGSVTVSAESDDKAPEVGGLQNTASFLGAAIGTALAGAAVMTALTGSFFTGIQANPDVPAELSSQAQVQLESGIPFIPDDSLRSALTEAGVSPPVADAVVAENEAARLAGLKAGLCVLALAALLGMFVSRSFPTRQPGDGEVSNRSAVPR
jgi:MFS family permease